MFLTAAAPALAGPPYVTDDPEPTDYRHFEIYAFTSGTAARGGTEGETGIDFNYGAAPDLQLGTTWTFDYRAPRQGETDWGLGNVELGAKYRFLHQDDFGWDVSVYPQLLLPGASARVGEPHASLFVPIWVQKDWGKWSTFGGGGCALDNGGGSKDWCLAGWALTRQVAPKLNLGIEIYHDTPDLRGGRASTSLGAGAIWDLSENYHLTVSFGPGIQNAVETNRYTWYAAILSTF
jgi:hypothetical protein